MKASDLQDNLLDLMDLNLIPIWDGMLYCILIIMRFADNNQIKP